MGNFSDLTRKEQVHAYLEDRANTWVDGTEIMNERVGGQRGGARVYDLRHHDKLDIRERRHPDPARDIHQYMLVTSPNAPGAPAAIPGPPAAPLCPICNLPLGDLRQTVSDAFVSGRCLTHGLQTVKR